MLLATVGMAKRINVSLDLTAKASGQFARRNIGLNPRHRRNKSAKTHPSSRTFQTFFAFLLRHISGVRVVETRTEGSDGPADRGRDSLRGGGD